MAGLDEDGRAKGVPGRGGAGGVSSSSPRHTGKDRPLYMISVAAELTGMHPQTLRIYESKGLVSPKRSNGNTRLYSQADIERLELIGRLTDEGINLAGAVRILDMRSQIEELNQEVDDLRSQVKSLREQVREYRTRETITTLTRYEGTNDVQGFLSRLLEETSGGVSDSPARDGDE